MRDEFRSGVQSPDRFACSYDAPPPLSQRHLLEALGKLEGTLKRVVPHAQEEHEISEPHVPRPPRPESVSSVGEGTPVAIAATLADDHDEAHDEVRPLPGPDEIVRTDSDSALAPGEYLGRQSRRTSEAEFGGRTPRQGRSRSRSRVRATASGGSRSGSPHVGAAGKKPKAFAFFGHVS